MNARFLLYLERRTSEVRAERDGCAIDLPHARTQTGSSTDRHVLDVDLASAATTEPADYARRIDHP
ncbi:hypothetical protein [Nocardia caishijiensis]|uniref:Uncharacterized protein n=1 Tax=Nocardia caishijiensis TaxID=184756 RepID=A0ABQ6YQ43_9NOCA|nr:hypothetical protein [Nocardia caishijiensis]KAF0847899.1 hypothetical protein FNL39_10239 [Nocardia caishijiensis]